METEIYERKNIMLKMFDIFKNITMRAKRSGWVELTKRVDLSKYDHDDEEM